MTKNLQRTAAVFAVVLFSVLMVGWSSGPGEFSGI
jgi:hypothetical protein